MMGSDAGRSLEKDWYLGELGYAALKDVGESKLNTIPAATAPEFIAQA